MSCLPSWLPQEARAYAEWLISFCEHSQNDLGRAARLKRFATSDEVKTILPKLTEEQFSKVFVVACARVLELPLPGDTWPMTLGKRNKRLKKISKQAAKLAAELIDYRYASRTFDECLYSNCMLAPIRMRTLSAKENALYPENFEVDWSRAGNAIDWLHRLSDEAWQGQAVSPGAASDRLAKKVLRNRLVLSLSQTLQDATCKPRNGIVAALATAILGETIDLQMVKDNRKRGRFRPQK